MLFLRDLLSNWSFAGFCEAEQPLCCLFWDNALTQLCFCRSLVQLWFVSSMVIRYLHLTDLEAGKSTIKKLISSECLLTVSHSTSWMSRATYVVCEAGSMAVFLFHPASLWQLTLWSFIPCHDLYLEAFFVPNLSSHSYLWPLRWVPIRNFPSTHKLEKSNKMI